MENYSENPVLNAMHQRQCFRAFEKEMIPESEVAEIMEAAGRAPSSKNTQPWVVFDVRGEKMDELRQKFLDAFDNGAEIAPDYQYSPNPLPDTWMARARQVGFSLFDHKGITREDKDKRHKHNRENYEFFGAPHALFLATTKDPGYGTFLDCGMFLQNAMLAFTAKGYGTCPMFSPMVYSKICHEFFPGGEDLTFICALTYGKPLFEEHVNKFRTIREPIENWYTITK